MGEPEGGESGNPTDRLISCVGAADQNLHVSLLNAADVVGAFDRLDQHLWSLSRHLSRIEFPKNDPFYVILNLLAMAQRQMRNGFVLCLRRQCYDGQSIFRRAVEATIFAYRVFRKPELGSVWVEKDSDLKAYRREFRFATDRVPDRMPFGKSLREYLDYLNEYHSHPNVLNFAGTLTRAEGRLELRYFDGDETFYPALFAYVGISIKLSAVFQFIASDVAKVFVTSTEADFGKIGEEYVRLTRRYSSKLPRSDSYPGLLELRERPDPPSGPRTITAKLKAVYFHELGFRCTEIRDNCQKVFELAPPPAERNFVIVPNVHSLIGHALTAAANVKKLLDDERPMNPRNESVEGYEFRKARAAMLKAELEGVSLTEMLEVRVRNSLEHFDEYLDEENIRLNKQSTPSIASYNVGFSHLDNMVFKEGPILHIRSYETTSRRFFHLRGSIDLGKVHDEAVAVLGRLIERKHIPDTGTTGRLLFLDFRRDPSRE